MQATAIAPANIALIKYWGRKNDRLRLPENSSIAINLSGLSTRTTVEFTDDLEEDLVSIDGEVVGGVERTKVTNHLNRIRQIAGFRHRAKVESSNNFPKSTGLASSASGFAALTLAATSAAGLSLPEKALSILARLGSGSACRSIPDGIVEWKAGTSNASSYARSLFPSEYWRICDVIALVGTDRKKISSTEGHATAHSSRLFCARIKEIPQKIRKLKAAIQGKDFPTFGEISEAEALSMHAVMITSKPPLIYWMPATLRVMHEIIAWRSAGLSCYYTIDAGPNVHVLCLAKDASTVEGQLRSIEGVRGVILNRPADGARLI